MLNGERSDEENKFAYLLVTLTLMQQSKGLNDK